ncbi:aminotransferase [Cellulophaga phage phi14:2]|uniref:glutamine--fructose-6-phosphate transaminase (isomerizing) n=1 Tax=Cellulophaga phage phi14:2 TaxID=1327990 RepID=S0A016_9CAUD|nr:aminotransferase [Cellulophaga phage phi14:2]AGO48929.1 glucosamine-fructose-6-phosphate aminotransferase [Cellulophaga phage phi14:2]
MTIIEIILVALFIHTVGFFLTKKRRINNVISCGLFGWIGATPEEFNKDKFDKLGIQNETRGKHSCGVSVDGELYKGVDSEKEYRDFIAGSSYPLPTKIPAVIGHTRYATGGAHNAQNAHPFKFVNDESDPSAFTIGAHNGVIKNYKELGEEFGIEVGDKIDSEVLLEILSKDNIDVLLKYYGAAALLIYSTIDPDSLWVFKGSSLSSSYVRTPATEERPLFFYQESPTSMYISSLLAPLRGICENDKQKAEAVMEFRSNILYKIKEGTIVKRLEIDRSKMNQTGAPYVRPTNNNAAKKETGEVNTSSQTTIKLTEGSKQTDSDNTSSTRINTVSENSTGSHTINNLHYEKAVFENTEDPIYYENTRYKSKGKLVTGVCILTEEAGFLNVASDSRKAKEALKNFSYVEEGSNNLIKFGDISECTLFFIHEGVLLKSELDYEACVGHLSDYGAKKILTSKYSFMSEYPLIDITRAADGIVYTTNQMTVKENKYFSGSFSPIGAYKTYRINYGDLTSFIIKTDLNSPKSSVKTLSIYNDGDFSDITDNMTGGPEEDDDDVFEENLSNELNDASEDDIKRIITLKDELNTALSYGLIEIDSLTIPESVMLDEFSNFIKDTQKRFKSISAMIEESINNNVTND